MRSTPHALTVIISRPNPKQYRDLDEISAASTETDPIEPASTVEEKTADQPLPKIAGLLVSSFNTVTLEPHVYVSFNIRLPSTTYTIMKYSNGFVASGLKDAVVADAFVKRHKTSAPEDTMECNSTRWQTYVLETDGRLKRDQGGTWWMRCRLARDKCVEVGDHVIVVAKVVACGGYSHGEGIGLVYAEGGYRKVEAEEIDLSEKRAAVDKQEQGSRRPSSDLSGSKEKKQAKEVDMREKRAAVINQEQGFRRPALDLSGLKDRRRIT